LIAAIKIVADYRKILPADYRSEDDTDRWLGQPYFFEPPQEDRMARAKMAAIGAIRLNFWNTCIRLI
jgi:hypothetical protein